MGKGRYGVFLGITLLIEVIQTERAMVDEDFIPPKTRSASPHSPLTQLNAEDEPSPRDEEEIVSPQRRARDSAEEDLRAKIRGGKSVAASDTKQPEETGPVDRGEGYSTARYKDSEKAQKYRRLEGNCCTAISKAENKQLPPEIEEKIVLENDGQGMICLLIPYTCCNRDKPGQGSMPNGMWLGQEVIDCMNTNNRPVKAFEDTLMASQYKMNPIVVWRWEGGTARIKQKELEMA